MCVYVCVYALYKPTCIHQCMRVCAMNIGLIKQYKNKANNKVEPHYVINRAIKLKLNPKSILYRNQKWTNWFSIVLYILMSVYVCVCQCIISVYVRVCQCIISVYTCMCLCGCLRVYMCVCLYMCGSRWVREREQMQ